MTLSKLDNDLIEGVKRRDSTVMKNALDKGANPDAVEDVTGRTALYYAASLDMSNFARGRMVSELLAKGADPNKGDAEGLTPLHVATRRVGWDTMDTLLEKGADINARAKNGATPLHIAAAVALGNGKTQTMERLIDKGANSLIRDEADKTPLDCSRDRAGFSNFYATVIEFLDVWEKLKPESRRHEEFTAANKTAHNKAALEAQERMRASAKKFKLKP